jgi:hypothetical protein
MTLPGLKLAVPLVGGALLLPHSQPAQAAPARAPQMVLASATAHAYRLVVTAAKSSSGAAPTATVHVTAYWHGASGWRPHGELQLGARDGFFWRVLEGSHAVRNLTISNDEPAHGSVQLLVTPALGWSPAYHFHTANGRLVR